jgi:hypothetical protein
MHGDGWQMQTFERAQAYRKAIKAWGPSVRGLLAAAAEHLGDEGLLELVAEAIEEGDDRHDFAYRIMGPCGIIGM